MSDLIVCNLCGRANYKLISEIKTKPSLETDYKISPDQYERKIFQCIECSAYFNSYDFKFLSEDFYSGFYNSSIDTGKLIDRFNRITSLPFKQSDNKQRVKRITDYLVNSRNFKLDSIELLDVGTGTGVFLHEANKFIKSVFCVDPDPNSIKLVKELIPVKEGWVGSVQDIPINYKFDIITFNKVLEHVHDPIQLLKQATLYLKHSGIIYIELPFSDIIVSEGKQDERAEFFIEHLTIYNHSSIDYLIRNAELIPDYTNTVIEPSGKHTIFTFCETDH